MPRPPTVLGVDPGDRFVGIVARRGTEVRGARILDRRRFPDAADRVGWVAVVLVAVDVELSRQADELDLGKASALATGELVLAVEDVKAPNPHVRRRDGNALTNLDGILGTAVVVGALVAAYPDLTLVAPGGNGRAPAFGYPGELGKGVRLGGPSDHARAAYDVAGAAAWRAITNRSSPS